VVSLTVKNGAIVHVTAYVFYEDLSKQTSGDKIAEVPADEIFVKQAYCLLTTRVPASQELNKINRYLRRAATKGWMYRPFEEYVYKLLFGVPMPNKNDSLKLYLPPGDLSKPQQEDMRLISEDQESIVTIEPNDD
jgi:hypothetical protein